MATAALTLAVLGFLGLVAGFIQVAYWTAGILSITAMVMGILVARRATQVRTDVRPKALTGAVLGGLTTAWFINGTLVTTNAFRQVSCADPQQTSTSPAEKTGSSPSSQPQAATAPGGGAMRFNTTRCFQDGLQVTVSAPKPYTPAKGASGYPPGARIVSVEVTIRNGSTSMMDLENSSSIGVNDAKGRPADPVFAGDDRSVGLGRTQLLPGMTKVRTEAFAVPPTTAHHLTVEAEVAMPESERTWLTVRSRHDRAMWNGPLR
ncbi:hypothetical protein YWIDRAFT_05287 [Streptomyces sp. SceaMP-e96]|uniref:hypothetical protein n=1 Tax=unclassified Streptomyces TaxID=2593676 RepID=UPI0008239899|nr:MULTISPECIES: hypothetical protein [unclassified Streptomyces]MYT15802.1 hypothetical protein [Streptomyces sp. SID4951]SCK24713.1 hypothetical protein YWIDRAFT_05287 [Streptomyces sp. SceaMP-e96]